ncbi:MAG: ABC transporter ATP-binding protein [Clostridiales bacterium]|nr:ABC transporter ATP-binding protein [Clostridiales bacterium]
MDDSLLCIEDLSIGIRKDKQLLYAVEEISFKIKAGEILGIVGESGCGKSLTALSILGLLPKDVSIAGGSIVFDKKDISSVKRAELNKIQGEDISIIFQDTMTSLNPLMKIGKQIGEVLLLHKKMPRKEIKKEVLGILNKVGIKEAERCYNSYPHQLSGGMRQRVGIAMAVICKPKLLIADEPTTALDVTTQDQILRLLLQIHKEFNMAILFISHDLGIVKQFCDRVIVMYAGKVVEDGDVNSIFTYPAHEYTKGLISSIPTRHSKGKRLHCIEGKVPNLNESKAGCPFALRCKKASDICLVEKPPRIILENNHSVCCHFVDMESEKK